MKSYFLGTLTVMGLTAIYVTNNAADINVSFIRLQGTFHQGLWEMGLFIAGVIISSLFSAGASIEVYIAGRKKTKELNKRIEELEDEKKTLLGALNNIGAKPFPHEAHAQAIASPPNGIAESITPRPEPKADDSVTPSAEKQPFIKGFLSSIFKKSEGGGDGKSPEAADGSGERATPDDPGDETAETREKETFTI